MINLIPKILNQNFLLSLKDLKNSNFLFFTSFPIITYLKADVPIPNIILNIIKITILTKSLISEGEFDNTNLILSTKNLPKTSGFVKLAILGNNPLITNKYEPDNDINKKNKKSGTNKDKFENTNLKEVRILLT